MNTSLFTCLVSAVSLGKVRNETQSGLRLLRLLQGGGQHQFLIILRVPEMEKEKSHLHEILKMFIIIITTTIIITMLIGSSIRTSDYE